MARCTGVELELHLIAPDTSIDDPDARVITTASLAWDRDGTSLVYIDRGGVRRYELSTGGQSDRCESWRTALADGAAHLVDRVLPLAADYRQWTLSFPRWLRIRLLRDKALTSEVLAVFVRIVSAYHRRRARERGFPGGQTGAVTAIQLGGSFVNANPPRNQPRHRHRPNDPGSPSRLGFAASPRVR